MLKEKMKIFWYGFARRVCYVFSRICFRMKISGKENIPIKGAVILVSNHQSFLDPIFCASGIKRHLNYLARDTLFKNHFFGWLLLSINVIPLRMGEADLSAMKTIIRKLQAGEGVLLFPEATRTTNGRISPFKPGLAFLCRRGNAAILPVLVEGAFECWPRHKKLFSIGKKIIVHYGRCIPADEANSMTDEQLADYLTKTIRQFQTEARLKEGKEPYSYQ